MCERYIAPKKKKKTSNKQESYPVYGGRYKGNINSSLSALSPSLQQVAWRWHCCLPCSRPRKTHSTLQVSPSWCVHQDSKGFCLRNKFLQRWVGLKVMPIWQLQYCQRQDQGWWMSENSLLAKSSWELHPYCEAPQQHQGCFSWDHERYNQAHKWQFHLIVVSCHPELHWKPDRWAKPRSLGQMRLHPSKGLYSVRGNCLMLLWQWVQMCFAWLQWGAGLEVL